MKCPAVCLVALALLGSFCDAQVGSGYKSPPKDPPQQRQTFEKPLEWRPPEDPTPPPKVEVAFVPAPPAPASTVAVECRENIAHVEVNKDMFGIGQFINPADLTLGSCGAVGDDAINQVLIYESELQGCSSTSMTTEEYLIYTFTLNYNPQPVGSSPVVRTSRAAVIVECYYPRKHNVSSLAISPRWIPFSAIKVAEEFLYFTMSLMTVDWMYARPSNQYYLGDMINIEVKVQQYYHVPLRVYVDYCVATLSNDVNSSPRYFFIENNGCFVDARLTGSRSKFMARTADDKLWLQLEAFRFQDVESGLMHITCGLKATIASIPIDTEHRACSYINGWREANGYDAACSSCDSGGMIGSGTSGVGTTNRGGNSGGNLSSTRKSRDVKNENPLFQWETTITLVPIEVRESKSG